jgi:uncharacterized protein (UPF0179 family)
MFLQKGIRGADRGMEAKKKLITTVPVNLAKEGYQFIFTREDNDECKKCKIRGACLENLTRGRRYVVKDVKQAGHTCPLVGLEAKVVEVQEVPFTVALERQRLMVGATLSYTPVDCNWKFCENYVYCVDNSLSQNDKIKILEKQGEVDCPRSFKLSFVLVKP